MAKAWRTESICAADKYLLSMHYVPDTAIGTGDTAASETGKYPCLPKGSTLARRGTGHLKTIQRGAEAQTGRPLFALPDPLSPHVHLLCAPGAGHCSPPLPESPALQPPVRPGHESKHRRAEERESGVFSPLVPFWPSSGSTMAVSLS